MLGAIPSTPGELLTFILLFILLPTYSGLTTNCPNRSSSDPLKFVSGTGDELIFFSRVNTELECVFNSSAIKNPCVMIFAVLSSSGSTLSRTLLFVLTCTHIKSYCLILYTVLIYIQNFASNF